MARRSTRLELPLRPRSPGTSLQVWLYRELRDAVLTRRLQPGVRLPASRDLARQHRLSRSTVVAVFEQLCAEGYLHSRNGSGTFVTDALPDGFCQADTPPASTPRTPRPQRGSFHPRPPDVFTPCCPPTDVFPTQEWARIISRRLRRDPSDMLQRTDPRGHPALREQIAAYVSVARSVRCSPDQVFIVTGTQQALDFTARVLLRPNDPVWMENPGYEGAVNAFRQAGARLVPVDIDQEGMNVAAALRSESNPRLAYVTPANQFPLCQSLSLARRTRLLEAAQQRDFYIFEDDYDGEFRYNVRPLGSLQGQDTSDRVIYCGSFNKVLHMGLRLGFLILPPSLIDRFLALRESADRYLPTLEQTALADFFAAGLYSRHLRRAREACLTRRDTLITAMARHLSDVLEPTPCEAGFHVLARIRRAITDTELTARAAEQRVRLWPLSPLYLRQPQTDQVVLGFAAHRPAVIQAAARRLAETCKALRI